MFSPPRHTLAQESWEQHLDGLVRDLPDMVYEVDHDGRICFINPAVRHILGYEPAELVGVPRRDLVAPPDRARFDRRLAQADRGQELSIMALRHLTKDGQVRWLSVNSRGLHDAEGHLVGRRGVARDVTGQMRAERRIHELSGQLIQAQEEERRRLALDLHDELGQTLSAIKIGLQGLAARQEADPGGELVRLIQLSQSAVERVRALAYNLRPAILDSFGLTAAIEDLCESLEEAGLLNLERSLQPLERLSPELEISLFRCVQEGLQNITRHSGATRAWVDVSLEGGMVRVSVRDCGRGFDAKAWQDSGPRKHLGLWGMRERLELLGGRLTIQSGLGGTTLLAEVPLGGEHGRE